MTEQESFNILDQLASTEYKPHWRPSWKQMEALKWTVDYLKTYDQIVLYLEELFDELKEL